MKIHILGICGTFMGGLAALARADGHQVSGSDSGAYPPMSAQLEQLDIRVFDQYDPAQLDPAPDLVIVGNALSRGNPMVEHVLNHRLPFTSGPRWLGENYLQGHTVLAVAGTHGKTSTASMLAWILEAAGREPGYLIGGVPANFGRSARASDELFVVEADEYDTAFFDKRAKFMHYRPHVVILNNLEFDHADIYPDLASIQNQFHHLVRIVPGNGRLIVNGQDGALREVLERGVWTPLESFGEESDEGPDWQVRLLDPAGSALEVLHAGHSKGRFAWGQCGRHNASNALAAVAAAAAVGVEPETAVAALAGYQGVRRRLELLGDFGGICVYDDFAHHPAAIRLTLEGLRRKVGNARILVALEPASNTMRAGHHLHDLARALAAADFVVLHSTESLDWDPQEVVAQLDGRGRFRRTLDNLLTDLHNEAGSGAHVVFMSNRSFDNAQRRFIERLGS